MGEAAKTIITLTTAGLPRKTEKALEHAVSELMRGQTQFVLLRKELPAGVVMQVGRQGAVGLARLRCFTPEAALEDIGIMLRNWPRM